MSALKDDRNRRILPRWRASTRALRLRETEPVKQLRRPLETTETFEEKLSSWDRDHDLPAALELVGAATLAGRETDVQVAAEFILQSEVTPLARKAVSSLLGGLTHDVELQLPKERLKNLRSLVRLRPENGIAWLDLGLAFAELGLKRDARRAVLAALGLEPNNRFVLRSGVRALVHLGEAEHAWTLLSRSPAVPLDPWLMAADIALASLMGKTSELTKTARAAVSSDSVSAFHLSELASALGTLEASAGNVRAARKLFRSSLLDPTENSVAQGRWAAQREGVIDFDPRWMSVPDSHEARAWAAFEGARWSESLREAIQWFDDQAFSVKPAILAAYLASTSLGDYSLGVSIADRGLKANPDEPLLHNNRAFALANLGDLAKARTALSKMIPRDDGATVCKLATTGLVLFREGVIDEGRRYYRDAIEKATSSSLDRLAARARIHYALEEARIMSPEALRAIEEADRFSRASKDVDTIHMRVRLFEAAEAFANRVLNGNSPPINPT